MKWCELKVGDVYVIGDTIKLDIDDSSAEQCEHRIRVLAVNSMIGLSFVSHARHDNEEMRPFIEVLRFSC